MLHFIHNHHRTLARLAPEFVENAANGLPAHASTRPAVSDLNLLVAATVGHVSALLQPERVNVELRLDPQRPIAHANPREVAFVVGGLVSSALRALEDGDGGQLRVRTHSGPRSVSVMITSDALPPLPVIRAVTTRNHSKPGVDPTVAHCRRLIEAFGGSLELIGEAGLLGFVVVFPISSCSRTNLPPTNESPSESPLELPRAA